MKLYVGTYAKYNRGSLAGAWLDLDEFGDADEFAAACRRVHSDERDPELMFQDVETDPGEDWQEGLYSESAIPRDYWTLRAEARAKAEPSAEKAEQSALLDEFMQVTRFDADMRRHFKGRDYFIRLANGEIFAIEKPRIQTRFCCGEDDRGQGGEDYGTMAYAEEELKGKRTEDGFKSTNLCDFDDGWLGVIGRRATQDRYYDGVPAPYLYLRPAYTTQEGDGRVLSLECIMPGTYEWQSHYYRHELKRPEGSRDVTDEDIRLIRAGYAHVRRDFKRRLNAYWKRFGASKIRTWTYWTEA